MKLTKVTITLERSDPMIAPPYRWCATVETSRTNGRRVISTRQENIAAAIREVVDYMADEGFEAYAPEVPSDRR